MSVHTPQSYSSSRPRNMARRTQHITRLFAAVTFALSCLETGAAHVSKRNSAQEVGCHVTGRFYRNPSRSEETMWSADECAKYYLCLEKEIFEFHCTTGLLFDVTRQLCDKPINVHNCDVITENPVPKPLLDKAPCANSSHLGCADGSCQPIHYFCDGATDCVDSSDEGWCDAQNDPNSATQCDAGACVLPDCFCSAKGRVIPGNFIPSQTPQMVTITLDGAVNHENWDIYTNQLFTQDRRNPNGCEIKATFFVTHQYTNYRHVQKLWNDGHEIGISSITNRGPEAWWSQNATVEDWFDEMVGEANIINRFANVRMEDCRGMRVPHLSVGWNRQFLMMQEFGFVYDASVVAPYDDSGVPFWPYTLDYKMPHECVAEQLCPTRSYAGIWEMVINPLVNGDNKTYTTLEQGPPKQSVDDILTLLMNNFKRHYLKNRAPFGIHLTPKWLKDENNLMAIKIFLDELLRLPDVYFVTYNHVMEWMKHPVPIIKLPKFTPWMCRNNNFENSEIACLKPNTCKLPSKILEHDRYMITCNSCPKTYPWIRNEFGFD